ncbi:ATP-binding protein [Vibrio hepatarius]|uniref:ATP-binding protein n=1 Tax=Vibrio hepatarius TaxID=171383 RepID=UPI00148CE7C1|nr:ATP-binding protein [Vibrio hepatarius]NOI14194.1 two-component sensor histidine kinase [Vibrio hepatarius]
MKNNVPFSIKRRLIGVVMILTLTMVSLALLFSAMSTKHETQEVYDARLGQTAKLLLLTTSSFESQLSKASIQSQFEAWMQKIRQLSDSDDDPTEYGHPYENNIVFQLYKNNALVWSSRKDAGVLSPSPEFSGFGDREVDGREWRIFQLHSTDSEFVLVAEKHSIRQEIINEVVLSAILPQMILFPLFIVILIYFIGKSFRPISELRLAISQRSIEKLDRIYVSNQTLELSPLVDTLNQLLEQLEMAWQRERQFTRMAAHEIKTPLTILRLNAENALHSQDKEQLEQDLSNLLKGIDRTDRVLHQLLTLAKVDSITNLEKQEVVLNNVLQSTLSDLAQLALRNDQHLSLEGDTCSIQGDAFLLGLLFRNLIDNAIRYSGNGSNIDVHLVASDYWYEVFISDTGQNISDEAREKLFDSFYRANTEKGDGAGLGMSIARDIAQLHNATLELIPREDNRNTFRIRFKR